MNKLADYFRAERGRAPALARRTGAAVSFLRDIAAGKRPCPPKLAVKIEQEADGHVSRKDLFPVDWQEIWPELAQEALNEAASGLESANV